MFIAVLVAVAEVLLQLLNPSLISNHYRRPIWDQSLAGTLVPLPLTPLPNQNAVMLSPSPIRTGLGKLMIADARGETTLMVGARRSERGAEDEYSIKLGHAAESISGKRADKYHSRS